MTDNRPRGIRNNNPGNVDYHPSSDPWNGLDDPPTDGRFCRFTAPEYGIRVMVKLLWLYQRQYACKSVRDIVNRWAPPVENDTGAYVWHVASLVGVGPDEPVDTHDNAVLVPLLKAIIEHENGVQPYLDSTITKAIEMAV